jgi:ribonucleotide reductase beta subunit family protein with ferritin-like domain
MYKSRCAIEKLTHENHDNTSMDRVNKWFKNDTNDGAVAFKSTDLPAVAAFQSGRVKTDKRLQIWPPSYEPSWRYYQAHQANHWYVNEHNPLDDLNGFENVDCEWQNALLQSFAVLAIGDDRVMSLIENDKLEWEETTRWFFADQAARETTHKIVYNRMLELARISSTFTVDTLTSDEFSDYLMDCGPINAFVSSEEVEVGVGVSKAIFLINMIMCERYLFAAPFLIINLMGESGLINTCVKINMQVMKDEHDHYSHAVQLLHDLKKSSGETDRIDGVFARLAKLFTRLVEPMVLKICIDLNEEQTSGIMDHTRFTMRTIFEDCGVSVPERLIEYTSTPFSVFDKNTGVDKFNLMESNSTVYKAGRSLYLPDWNALQDSIKREEEEEDDEETRSKKLKLND